MCVCVCVCGRTAGSKKSVNIVLATAESTSWLAWFHPNVMVPRYNLMVPEAGEGTIIVLAI